MRREALDDREMGKVPDPGRVSLFGAWETDYWTYELGVSNGELIRIIAKVGTSIAAVRKELGLTTTPRR